MIYKLYHSQFDIKYSGKCPSQLVAECIEIIIWSFLHRLTAAFLAQFCLHITQADSRC